MPPPTYSRPIAPGFAPRSRMTTGSRNVYDNPMAPGAIETRMISPSVG